MTPCREEIVKSLALKKVLASLYDHLFVAYLNDFELTPSCSFTGFTLYIVFAHGFHFAKSTTPFRIVNNPKASSVFVRNEVSYPFPEMKKYILYKSVENCTSSNIT